MLRIRRIIILFCNHTLKKRHPPLQNGSREISQRQGHVKFRFPSASSNTILLGNSLKVVVKSKINFHVDEESLL